MWLIKQAVFLVPYICTEIHKILSAFCHVSDPCMPSDTGSSLDIDFPVLTSYMHVQSVAQYSVLSTYLFLKTIFNIGSV